MTKRFFLLAAILIVIEAALSLDSFSQTAKPAWQVEWDRTIELAKKEGKVVISIPAAAELRQALEDGFKKRFAIPVESVPARGAAVTRRIVDESKAGISYFDLHIGGSESIVTGILPENILEPIEPWMILPQVKEPKNWWGGHIWIDNAKRFVYAFQAYQTENLWYNTDLAKPEEIRSFDDLLHPKWQGKIGILDPRTPGSGASLWSYLRDIKGEDYLKKLVAQKLQVGRDQRLLSENLAKGKVSLVMGLTYYSIVPFLKAGLPVKPLPNPREGVYVSGGSGHLTIIKNPPHPNATKVFVNWLLGKEGQEIFSRSMGQATRRLDVDTKALKELGVIAAKEAITLEQYYKLENQSEKKVYESREPGADLARKLLD
jgi:iron(III) transport system substrate-binding protein